MHITFNDVCNLLEEVEQLPIKQPRLSTEKAKDATRKIVNKWFVEHRQALDSAETNPSAVLSVILPHRRKDRVYGLQQPRLVKKIPNLLQFNRGQLAIFNRCISDARTDLGESMRLAMRAWDGTFKSKCLISIHRVDRLLTQLAARFRFSDPSIRKQRDVHMQTDAELAYILRRLESWEAKWFIRLLLRVYPTINLDERLVFEQYHFLLPDLLKFQNDFDAAFSMLRGELACYPPVPDPSLQSSMKIEASKRLKAVVGVKVGRPAFYKAWSFKHCFQMAGTRAWAADVKYDGEYCEIHVDLDKGSNSIQIFSKNGKDATADRSLLHPTIRDALRIGQSDCFFKRKCIVLGEMVLWSDKEKKILPFSKIRKHITRSGSFFGTLQDSHPHKCEHLMVVYFDVLMVDDQPVMRKCLQDRRQVLRDLIKIIPGRSHRSEWTLVDLNMEHGITDLKQAFARTLARCEEGLVLKPLHAPYFPLLSEVGNHHPGFFIKLKKDYLSDMGGQRDLGDFSVIGACFDPQVAPKAQVKPLHWTHFHLGCVMNKTAIEQTGAKPKFRVVACVSFEHCIPKTDFKHLNTHGIFRKAELNSDGSIEEFEIDHGQSYNRPMTVAFRKPFVVEVLGSGFEKVQNESFEMLRHPRVKKIHSDRTWEDTVTIEDLERMAGEQWEMPDPQTLGDHAKDVALMVKRYLGEAGETQVSTSEYETTQEITQTLSTSNPHEPSRQAPSGSVILETQQATVRTSSTAVTSSQYPGSTQADGIRVSKDMRTLIREDTSERLGQLPAPSPSATTCNGPSSSTESNSTARKRSFEAISPPSTKRKRRPLCPLTDAEAKRNFGAFEYDTQDKSIHIYTETGLQVRVHLEVQQSE